MKFKLDENIGRGGAELLVAGGHEVLTVRDQGLAGAPDETVFEVCVAEAIVLITLDRDFGQVLRFPPPKGGGIVVLELPARPTPDSLLSRLRELLVALASQPPIDGHLWIVEPGRVRIRQRADEDDK